MTDKPLIVFVGAVYPSQYSLLCSHLRAQGIADAWFMTTPGHKANHEKHCDHLLSFQPDGLIVGPQSYYYSDKVERSARICRGVLKALEDFETAQGRKIDVVVAHSLWGAPNWLYGELQAAIISYIEFPSYLAHGWDAAYPPDQAQRLGDRNTEMLSFHQVLCSDLTIVPSAYARSMFPPLLQDRIAVQFEGFDIQPPLRNFSTASDEASKSGGGGKPFTIAFSARDLSSAKGFETYIRLVDRMVREGDGQNTRFIAIGDAKASTYGYEQQWVERRYGGKVESFRDHLLKVYPAADVIEFPGHLPYAQFSALLAEVDLFLYPLRYGVANWGLMEILARGGCVIGSNWGFAPELITHNVNGLLLPDNDDDWIEAIRQLRRDPARRQRYALAALETGKAYHIAKVAPRFMALFARAMANRKAPLVAPR